MEGQPGQAKPNPTQINHKQIKMEEKRRAESLNTSCYCTEIVYAAARIKLLLRRLVLIERDVLWYLLVKYM